MLRKGFTLIELLIVITIIAILAGAAIPYVQDYVEDARISKSKTDIIEIKTALMRFELDRGAAFTATTIASLVGPYLAASSIDGWGVPYEIDATSSLVLSWGPDRTDNGGLGDDISSDFRPPMALSKAYFIDNDKSETMTDGDAINLRFTRDPSLASLDAANQTAWEIRINGVAESLTIASATYTGYRLGRINITTAGANVALFTPGRDTINKIFSTLPVYDRRASPLSPATCSANLVAIQSL